MTAAGRWMEALWPAVRGWLPPPPARIVEIGCGPLGGFVPMLRADGYDAVGVDPHAPDEAGYRRVEFERFESPRCVGAVVASSSLHHVADPAVVIDRIARILVRGGALVVIEWDWQRFDAATAAWSFERLGRDREGGWLRRRRDEWLVSDQPWPDYVREWARREHLQPAATLVRLLDERFEREYFATGPYLFPDLAEASEEDERAAIEAGQIQPTRLEYVGRLRELVGAQ